MARKKEYQNPVLEYALNYAKKYRWHVFRLASNSKQPMKRSNGFKDATTNSTTIRDWFNNNSCNIGIRTGRISNLVVVDIDKDDQKDGFKSIEALGSLPETYTVKTKRGNQYYFTYPKNGYCIGSTQNLGDCEGIDIRGDEGYVVAPTKHSSKWCSL